MGRHLVELVSSLSSLLHYLPVPTFPHICTMFGPKAILGRRAYTPVPRSLFVRPCTLYPSIHPSIHPSPSPPFPAFLTSQATLWVCTTRQLPTFPLPFTTPSSSFLPRFLTFHNTNRLPPSFGLHSLPPFIFRLFFQPPLSFQRSFSVGIRLWVPDAHA
jgi:hypothetical protein